METAENEARKRQEFEARRKVALEEQARQTDSDARTIARRKLRDKALAWNAIVAWLVLGGLAGLGIAIGGQWGWGIIFAPVVGWFATMAGFAFYFLAVNFIDRTMFGSNASIVTALSLYWVGGPAILALAFYAFVSGQAR